MFEYDGSEGYIRLPRKEYVPNLWGVETKTMASRHSKVPRLPKSGCMSLSLWKLGRGEGLRKGFLAECTY
jgi:hypothetical protein